MSKTKKTVTIPTPKITVPKNSQASGAKKAKSSAAKTSSSKYFVKKGGARTKVLKPRKKAVGKSTAKSSSVSPTPMSGGSQKREDRPKKDLNSLFAGDTLNKEYLKDDVAEIDAIAEESAKESAAPSKKESVEVSEKSIKADIRRTIEESKQELAQEGSRIVERKTDETSSVKDRPTEFDGVSDDGEREQLVDEQLSYYQKQAGKLKHELEMLKNEFKDEKKSFEKTVRELKKELHRTDPIHDNKFFSLSKDLREALSSIEELVDPDVPVDEKILAEERPQKVVVREVVREPEQEKAMGARGVSVGRADDDKVSGEEMRLAEKILGGPKKKRPKLSKQKKLLITGVVLLFVMASGAMVSYRIIKQPDVDQALVDDYLQKAGEVQGAQQVNPDRPPQGDKQADLPFEETKWEKIDDGVFGIRYEYPANLVEKQKNGNGLAFLRKDGYLFKMQHIETEDTIEEHWEKTKDSGLEYEAEEAELNNNNNEVLKLSLQEETDFPGDKYLIQMDGAIIEIWYATESDKFTDDDIRRAEYMVNSIRLLN